MAKTNGIEHKEQPRTKAELVERLLAGKGGASLAELMERTGWQAHTCRAFFTGLRKKGRVLVRGKCDDGTSFYRLYSGQEGGGIGGAVATPAEGTV